MTQKPLDIKRRRTRGALTWEAVIAIGVLVLAALAVTSLSVRQLALIRQTSKVIAREQLARSIIASIEADLENLHPQTQTLEPVILDGVTYQRKIIIREVTAKLLELRCSLRSDRREFLYVKKVIAP